MVNVVPTFTDENIKYTGTYTNIYTYYIYIYIYVYNRHVRVCKIIARDAYTRLSSN